jgi:hypothetical protein
MSMPLYRRAEEREVVGIRMRVLLQEEKYKNALSNSHAAVISLAARGVSQAQAPLAGRPAGHSGMYTRTGVRGIGADAPVSR